MKRVYDVVMTHQLDTDGFFIHRVQFHCAERGLDFFLVEPHWVEPFRELLATGKIRVRTLLNLHSEHHDPGEAYHRLVRLAHECGVQVIDPPDIALAAFDKARLHPRLVAAGFNVPHSVIVPGDQAAAWELSDADRVAMGSPFVIKPGMGYGKRGVILDARGMEDIRRSAAVWPGGDYLLQRRIEPGRLGGDPGYFRVFFAFDATWCCWWHPETDAYRELSAEEESRWALAPLREIARRLAALTGMRFFSSEIAVTATGDFVLIDYVNDQCHMLSQSANPRMGVPDAVVAGIARRLVEGAHQLAAGHSPEP